MKKIFLLCSFLVAFSAAAEDSYVVHGTLTSGTGWRKDPFGSGRWTWHQGYDIAMPKGTPVYPAAPGQVVFSGWHNGGYGWLVAVDHRNGYVTLYGHCSKLVAKVGDWVEKDTLLALSGSSGKSTGNHLHYQIVQASK